VTSGAGNDGPQVVRAGYDRLGERYHDWSHAGSVRLRYVGAVLERLAPGSTVVDLGCGPGDPATRLLSEKHIVLGVDISAGQLAIARRLAPRASFVQADLTRFTLQPHTVDAVVSFYATGHLPQAAHAPFHAEVARWLPPGGLLVTSAPLMTGEDDGDEWLGVPMFFGGIGAAATVAAVEAAGLVVQAADEVDEQVDGRVERFQWVTAVSRGAAGPGAPRAGQE
jgi:cyclopropane fatty-acyl-phospholipid synthase-like methyltransferase